MHVRRNAVAYTALFFALGGGSAGPAVVAATQSSGTVHACVSRKNGAVYIARRCTRTTRALVFNQQGPAGPAGPQGATGTTTSTGVVAWGSVGTNGGSGVTSGMTIQQTAPGVFNVTITAPSCAGNGNQDPVVSANGGSPADPPNISAISNLNGTIQVNAGQMVNGTYSPGNQGFDIQDACVN